MKILLVIPHPGRRETPIYPLGPAYVAAALRAHGHTVRGCDLQLAERPDSALADAVTAFAPELIAIALRNADTAASYEPHDYLPAFAACVRQARRGAPRVPIVVGGPGFSLFAEAVMRRVPEIDLGIRFEAEAALPRLLEDLAHPGRVPGVCYRVGARIEVAPEPPGRPDFAALGTPDRTVFPVAPYVARDVEFGVQTKRGCAFRCVYCTYPLIDGRTVRTRRVEEVADELEQLAARGVRRVFFCDSIFNFPPEHAEALCREITRRGIRLAWHAYFNERFVTPDLPRLAREAGCDTLIFGPDAGHARTLAHYGKDMTREEMEAAYAACRRAGARFRVAFMINGPGESLRTLLAVLATLLRLRLRQRVLYSLTTIRIYPGTGLQRVAVERGLIRADDDLLRPAYYDPYPLRVLTTPLSLAGRWMCRWKRATVRTRTA